MNRKVSKILIIGHSGFMGKALYSALKKSESDVEIVGVSTSEIDLTEQTEFRKMEKIINKGTIVIICSFIKKQVGDNLENLYKNMTMTKNICDCLKSNENVVKAIFISSAALYGEDIENTNINESSPIVTNTYYALAKYCAEKIYGLCLKDTNSKLLILRPPTVYGPEDSAGGYTPSGFYKKLYNNEKITLWGDGTELRSFLFIEDFVNILKSFLYQDYEGIVNIAPEDNHSFLEVLNELKVILDKNVIFYEKKRTKNKVDHKFDNSLLRSVIGDYQFISLKEGLHKIYLSRQSMN